ncbi:MAG: DinB family protein [Pseudomonadota bacterium]
MTELKSVAALERIASERCEVATCNTLVAANVATLEQLAGTLAEVSDRFYADQPDEKTSSMGMHVRHIIEFYLAFLIPCEEGSDHPKGVLCYDARERDLRYETDRSLAINEIAAIVARLKALPRQDTTLHVAAIVDPEAPPIAMQTTRDRELFHVLDHAIHHMALIKLVGEKQGLSLALDFGLANSTKTNAKAKAN